MIQPKVTTDLKTAGLFCWSNGHCRFSQDDAWSKGHGMTSDIFKCKATCGSVLDCMELFNAVLYLSTCWQLQLAPAYVCPDNLIRASMMLQDKILQSVSRDQKVTVTNDGATILKSLYVDNPAAKVLVGERCMPDFCNSLQRQMYRCVARHP